MHRIDVKWLRSTSLVYNAPYKDSHISDAIVYTPDHIARVTFHLNKTCVIDNSDYKTLKGYYFFQKSNNNVMVFGYVQNKGTSTYDLIQGHPNHKGTL